MDPANFTLLIHHHNVAYQVVSGEIWLPAGVARWVSAIAVHFKAIGLLLHQSAEPLPKQDTPIRQKNVHLYSLGPPGHYWDRFERMSRIRRVCQREGVQADGLLIRGMTSRQYTVWKHTPVSRKAFMLVRSPRQRRIFSLRPIKILSTIMNRQLEREFIQIAKKDTLLMANSPTHLPEIERLSGKEAYFVSTNILQEAEFAPLHVRPISIPCRLLYVGRLIFLKGLRELIKAVSILGQGGQACDLEIVAAKQEPVYTQLRELAEQLGVAKQLHFRGFVPFGPELFKFYQSADVVVLPSYTEGFPRVIWEAAANCCPVIATSVGGIPAIIEHEKHALLIPPKDEAAIVTAVERLLSDELLRQRLVVSAYGRAQEFCVEANAKNLVDILSKAWN